MSVQGERGVTSNNNTNTYTTQNFSHARLCSKNRMNSSHPLSLLAKKVLLPTCLPDEEPGTGG